MEKGLLWVTLATCIAAGDRLRRKEIACVLTVKGKLRSRVSTLKAIAGRQGRSFTSAKRLRRLLNERDYEHDKVYL